MSGTNRFVARAEAWAQLRLSGTSYEYSVSEDPYDSSTDPSKRQLVVKFSKPSKECPVAPASAKVTVIIHAEKTNYVVKGYMVEGRKQVYAEDFPFNEAWLDRVISQKLALRESLNLDGDSEFLKTRLPGKGETAADASAAPSEEKASN